MKFFSVRCLGLVTVSPPSRGAWIEMSGVLYSNRSAYVAPLAGGVD